MKKLEGHVLQPVMSWMRKELKANGKDLHEKWSFRPRCVPDWEAETKNIAKELEALEERTMKKVKMIEKELRKLGLPEGLVQSGAALKRCDLEAGRKVWKRRMDRVQNALTVPEVREMKKKLRGMAVTPLDKVAGEGMIV